MPDDQPLTKDEAAQLCALLKWAQGQQYHWLSDRSYRDLGFMGAVTMRAAWRKCLRIAQLPDPPEL